MAHTKSFPGGLCYSSESSKITTDKCDGYPLGYIVSPANTTIDYITVQLGNTFSDSPSKNTKLKQYLKIKDKNSKERYSTIYKGLILIQELIKIYGDEINVGKHYLFYPDNTIYYYKKVKNLLKKKKGKKVPITHCISNVEMKLVKDTITSLYTTIEEITKEIQEENKIIDYIQETVKKTYEELEKDPSEIEKVGQIDRYCPHCGEKITQIYKEYGDLKEFNISSVLKQQNAELNKVTKGYYYY